MRGNVSDTIFSLILLLAASHNPPSKMADVSAAFGCLTIRSVHS